MKNALVLIPTVVLISTATFANALPIKTIYSNQAQGASGKGLDLKIWPGYDLVISFLDVGETITSVRLGDPTRIGFGSDGNLCPISTGSTEGQCKANGANVIFFRQIGQIPLPYIISSPDGSTQATIVTTGNNGKKIYPIRLVLAKGTPDYTTIVIKPDRPLPTRPATLPMQPNYLPRRPQTYDVPAPTLPIAPPAPR